MSYKDQPYEEAFLLSAANSIEADMIEAFLKANDIPVLKKYREAGGFMMVYMGGTVFGVDLYVPKQLLDKAAEIVENSREASKDAGFPDNVMPDDTKVEEHEESDTTKSDASNNEE